MDAFERYLTDFGRQNPHLSALVEAVSERYKNSHLDGPSGTGIWTESNNAGGLFYPHLSAKRLAVPNSTPPLQIHLPIARKRQVNGQSNAILETADPNIAKNEGDVNSIVIDHAQIAQNLTKAIREIGNSRLKSLIDIILDKSVDESNTQAALFNLIMRAMLDTDQTYNSHDSKYIKIQRNGDIVLVLRPSDHYLVVANALNLDDRGNIKRRLPSGKVATLQFPDTKAERDWRKKHPGIDAGTKFDNSPLLRHSDIKFNIIAFKNDADAPVNLIKMVLAIVSACNVSKPFLERLKQKFLPPEDGVDFVSIKSSPKESVRNNVKRPHNKPLTNLGESVMNTYQKSYTAFMESVCNKFNCPDALPALKEGFNAFCEAVAPSYAAKYSIIKNIGDRVTGKIHDIANTYLKSSTFRDYYKIARAYGTDDECDKYSPEQMTEDVIPTYKSGIEINVDGKGTCRIPIEVEVFDSKPTGKITLTIKTPDDTDIIYSWDSINYNDTNCDCDWSYNCEPTSLQELLRRMFVHQTERLPGIDESFAEVYHRICKSWDVVNEMNSIEASYY